MEQIKNHNKITKPTKLLAGFLFLYLAYFMVVLSLISYVWGVEQANSSEKLDLLITYQTVLFLIVQIWLTFNIIKGINWSRYYLLIFIVAGIPKLWFDGVPVFYFHSSSWFFKHRHSFYIDFYKTTAIELIHGLVPFVFIIIGLIFLFCKDSSSWFKQVKQSGVYKKTISNSVKASSMCFYSAYGISILSYIIFLCVKIPSNSTFVFLYLLGFLLFIIISINIFFIYAINKGSKLVGIIYLVFVAVTQVSCYIHFTTHFDLHDLFLAARPYNLGFGVILGYIQIPIQVTGFIFLFQNDIVKCFSKFFFKK